MSNLIKHGEDGTLSRNSIKYWKALINDYELIKIKKHHHYRFVNDFYQHHNIKRQNFIKYYNRFKQNYCDNALLPQKRGPKYKTRKTLNFIEQKVITLRNHGMSRYDIYFILQPILKSFTPSKSTIYNILKRNGINRLTPVMKKSKRKIIKNKLGELGHIDCHYLPKNIIVDNSKRFYLVAVIDDYSRVMWCELVENITSLTVMFATLKIFTNLSQQYNIKFDEMLSDNGAEFGSGPHANNKDSNPFERMLKEMKIKHRYTRPYRPQTNGKIERFWKTIKYDFLEDMLFDSIEHFKDELIQYNLYYNEARHHQAIDTYPVNMTK